MASAKNLAILFAAFFMIGCQTAPIPIESGAPAPAVIQPAVEGSRNIDLFDSLASVDVDAKEVIYFEDTKGYLAMPKDDAVYPAVIMIHEWWGLNDNMENMARLLADEGYVVLAVDLYSGEIAANSTRAGELAGAVRANPDDAVANMRGAAAYLKGLSNVDDSKVASLGWCFGGGQSLQLALSGENLAATVIYYGQLVPEEDKLLAISWPVLGVFGEADTSIPVASVNEFKESLDSLGIKNEIYIYPDVGHAFANPSGANYAAKETLDAWDKTVKFLNANLK